ncbi:N-acetylmuramoyl-L-alanine amidase [Microvirga antarctica]|uniref:N-acetylmuramoyl-L-alanine amidase n=1 Tax=Microvirga antarctica TaxID=2819233 RepID=UPI001FEA1F71|nr:N-acetylmuramoyl-L-alanine amidase [Microvirga antarctica]
MHIERLTHLLCVMILAAVAVAGVPDAWAQGGNGIARPASTSVIAAAVTVRAEADRTLFSVTLSEPVEANAHLMEGPDRVIVDLPEVAFHVPTDQGSKREGLIASYRFGLFAPGRSRVVIDLSQPATVADIRVQTDAPGGAAVLIIELKHADRDEFRKVMAANPAKSAKVGPEREAVAEKADERPIIVIDPGHGGIDPGANGANGIVEKDLVLTFARELRKRLSNSGYYRVVLTRDEDVFISLGDRVRAARGAKADLFISIHADSISGGQGVRGLTVYTGAERASDAESARLADRENKADAAAGMDSTDGPDEVVDILQELTSRETRSFSHRFAGRLVGELDSVAQLNKNPRREAGFRVLRAHDVPSVLLELGYLSSRKDLDLLVSDEWRGKAIGSMAVAIDRFFAQRLARQGAAAVSP